jgi:hypothetical protein
MLETSPIPLNQVLIEITSIAIWNRERVVVAMAITVWVVNVAFLVQGKSPLSTPSRDL